QPREWRADDHLDVVLVSLGRGHHAAHQLGCGRRGDRVHLPVRGQQRLALDLGAHPYSSLRTATPGNSLPSMYSSVAPPPVETCENRPASPRASTAAAASPPPTREYAPEPAIASPTRRVPRLKSGISLTPTGPFQTTVRAAASSSVKTAMLSGPMSSIIQPGSMESTRITRVFW